MKSALFSRLFAVGALTAALLSSASATLELNITEASPTAFGFNISGDFTGLTAPASELNWLYVVPVDSSGTPVTTWIDGGFQAGESPSPDGAIDGSNTVNGWGITEGFFPSDAFVMVFSTDMSTSSVVTAPITFGRSAGLDLDMTNVAGFDLYWGANQVASSSVAVPEPSSVALAVGGMSILGYAGLRRRRK